MKIFNIRFGFATNSSSTHSLAFTNEILQDSDCEQGEFGWQNFVAASDDMKLLYIAIHADNLLRGSIPDNSSRQALIQHLLGNNNIELGGFSHIDHQSSYALPLDWSYDCEHNYNCETVSLRRGTFIDVEFLREFRDYFLQDGLVILGGNDNDKAPNPLRASLNSLELPIPRDSVGEWVARKDPRYNYWVMFNREDGTKVRFSFDNIHAEVPDRASVPELLDIKITECCPYSENTAPRSCARFCYQNSQVTGEILSRREFYRLATCLRELKVFEVALGGGEPTSHPHFHELLISLRREGVIPNFSTRDLSWLRDNTRWPVILDNCGSFAYSVRNAREIKVFHRLIQDKGNFQPGQRDHKKISLQVVMGTLDKRTYRNILVKAGEYGYNVTLLGYKNIGRGRDFSPLPYNWFISIIQEISRSSNHLPHVSIDTSLAAEFEDELTESGVPSWLFHTQEGRFSGYLDAVRGKFGPSSFCNENQMVDFTENGRGRQSWIYSLDRKIIECYSKFQ